ncbi:MAG: type II secretion system protein [Candidatus Saccharimonadales bacterium]
MSKSLITCRSSSGITLVEIIVATAVTGILIAVIMSFFSDKMVANATASARSRLLMDAQLSLDVINRDIKHSARVDEINRWADAHAPDSPGDDFSWESNAEVLILASPAVDSNNNFIYQDSFAYITYKNNLIYFVENGNLYKRILAAEVEGNAVATTCPEGTSGCPTDTLLASNISDFSVLYYNANDEEVVPADENARSVRVNLSISDTVYSRKIEAEFSIRSVFRNE